MGVDMKRLAIAMCALFGAVGFSSHARAEDWWAVSISDLEYWAIDIDTVSDVNMAESVVRMAWFLKQNGQMGDDGVSFTRSLYYLDCENQLVGVQYVSEYSESGKFINSFNYRVPRQEYDSIDWQPIIPGSVGERSIEITCNSELTFGRQSANIGRRKYYKINDIDAARRSYRLSTKKPKTRLRPNT